MNYRSISETAEKWGISQRRVLYLLRDGRIRGAKLVGTHWVIPEDAEKPMDGRTKAGKTEQKENGFFRFPLFVNKAPEDYSPPLSADELVLREAQLDFLACRFEESREKCIRLLRVTGNRYIRIFVLFLNCMLCILSEAGDDWYEALSKFQASLAESFPHQKEMQILLSILDDWLSFTKNLLEDFSVDPCYQYDPAVHYLQFNLSLMTIYYGDYAIIQHHNYDFAEVVCQQMHQQGCFYEEQELHYTLACAYHMQKSREKMLYHIKRILDIAMEKDFYVIASSILFFFSAECRSVLADYPESFAEKILHTGKLCFDRYADFIIKHKESTFFHVLSREDYPYLYFATQGYSFRELAKYLNTTPVNVGNRYHEICKKLGVSDRKELLELFNRVLNEPIV